MANVYAIKTGNWSDTTVWNTGALPTGSDDVWANTFTVTIDTSPTVLSVRTTSTTGITAGGGFTVTNGITLTCTGSGIIPGTTACVTSNLVSGQSCTINANSTGSSTANAHGILNNSSGTLIIAGYTTSASGSSGIANGSSGAINITGTIQAVSTNSSSPAVRNSSSGTINITGNVTAGGTQAYGVYNTSTGLVNITGNVTGGSDYGAINFSTGTINITGTVTGGASTAGAVNSSTGILTHIGSAIAGTVSNAIGLGSTTQNTFLTGPFIGTAQGVAANVAVRWRWVASAGPSYTTVANSTATGYKNLYTADSTLSASGQPAASNVRSGVIYGPNSELTGTCAVPVAGSVVIGAPVDNTIGTAVLSAASAKEACSKAIVPALIALG